MIGIKSSIADPIAQYLEEKPGTTSLGMALFFALLLVIYRSLTIKLSICSGAGDCVKYSEMARSFASGEYGPIDFPFNLRIMAPWLASIFAQDVAKGFIWLNGASALLFVIFCFGISRLLAIRNVEFWILVLWFFLHPLGFSFYSSVPQSVDPLSYAFIGLITLLFISEKRLLLWLAVSLALLAKESFSFIAITIAVAELTYAISTRDKRAIPALASICGAVLILLIYKIEKNLILTYLFPQSQEWEITTFSTISWWFNEIWNDPKRLIVWIGAILCSTGLFSIFICWKKYTPKPPSKTRLDAYFALGGFGYIALGLLAGSDMSRIIFNGNLFIILAILISFKNQHLPINQLLITFFLSMLIALNYTRFFPSAFEYDYNTQGHRIGPTIYFILITISIMSCLHFLFKIHPGNKNILIDTARDVARFFRTQMNSIKIFSLNTLSWFVFFVILLTYGFIYAPYGLENNDGGFILGLSYQVFLGNSFYDNIIYVRPPVSPILHSFVFHYPFSSAPVFFDRFFVFLQISTYSALSAMLAKKMFIWGSAFTGVVASIIFVFSAHSFPPMAWHTIDGIFFSVIALYFLVAGLKDHHGFLLLSACFSILAAGSKQPFYLTPIILLALSFILEYKMRAFYIMLASLFCAGSLFILTFKYFGSVESMWGAISSQNNLHDLFSAGVKNYVSDFIEIRSVVAAWPLFAVLTFGIFWNKSNRKFEVIALLVAIWIFLLIIAQFYLSISSWSGPLSVFDSVFMTTFLYSSVMMWREQKPSATFLGNNVVHEKRQGTWIFIVAMHIIGWASSISWGYLTAILYAAPSVITLAFILHPACKKYLVARIISTAILPVSALIFYVGNQFTYSLEGSVHRAAITADMAEISPSLKFIKAEPEQFQLYSELTRLLNRFGDHPYVVLPNMPLAHILTSTANPIGIDWPLNAEVGENEKIIKDRLASTVHYALIFKKASQKLELSEKFGSKITIYVMQNWKLMESSENFSIYVNPVRDHELIN